VNTVDLSPTCGYYVAPTAGNIRFVSGRSALTPVDI
jgi:hypothetical protein